MKLKACNRIGLVLAGVWIIGAIVYTLSILESPRDAMWVNTHLVILALVSVAAYVLPFLVRWILKGFAD
jgi:hypothetical protein